MKATEQFFPLVLFIMKYKVVLTFDSVDEILKCNHSNESYRGEGGGGGVLFYGIVYYAVQRVSSISFVLVFGLSSFLF